MEQVKITYLGHACFCLMYKDWRIILDPYADDNVPGLAPLRVDAERVYCSHSHGDHSYVEAVTLKRMPGTEPYTMEEIITPHDDAEGAKRGMNTIRIFTFGDLRLAHMGDLGRVLTEEEAEKLRGVDCMLLPVGGFYTIDSLTAKTVAEQVQPRVLVPMHYRTERSGYPVIAEIGEFTKLYERVNSCGKSFRLNAETPAQVLVMDNFGEDVLDIREVSRAYHSKRYNCAQSVLCACGEYTGLDEETALAIAGGFGAGLASGEVCGAISGAVMAISLCAPYTDCSRPEDNARVSALAKECVAACREKLGAVTCRDLLEQEKGNHSCPRIVMDCAEIAENMIRQIKGLE